MAQESGHPLLLRCCMQLPPYPMPTRSAGCCQVCVLPAFGPRPKPRWPTLSRGVWLCCRDRMDVSVCASSVCVCVFILFFLKTSVCTLFILALYVLASSKIFVCRCTLRHPIPNRHIMGHQLFAAMAARTLRPTDTVIIRSSFMAPGTAAVTTGQWAALPPTNSDQDHLASDRIDPSVHRRSARMQRTRPRYVVDRRAHMRLSRGGRGAAGSARRR
jgi:hypothetical protein